LATLVKSECVVEGTFPGCADAQPGDFNREGRTLNKAASLSFGGIAGEASVGDFPSIIERRL
jgi:hypothetical protein